MKEVNIIQEINQLHLLVGRKLFEMNQHKDIRNQPRPLQIAIIDFLLHHEDEAICQKDIQLEIDVSKAAISSAICSMEKQGFIERISDQEDSRKNRIILLPLGKEIYDDFKKSICLLNQEVLEGIGYDDLNEFLRISEEIKNNIRKRDVDDKII